MPAGPIMVWIRSVVTAAVISSPDRATRLINMRRSFVLFILSLILLSGCGFFGSPTPAETETPLPSETLTATPSPTASNTPTPTVTSTNTSTPTPSVTPTVTFTPTPELTARLIWPRAMFGPGDVTWRDYTCPQEGQRLACEFEYRKDSSFNCYVGGTCYDACGWFYSVDTIPPGVNEFSGPCW